MPPALVIRRAIPEDLPTVLALLERAEMYTSSVTLSGDVTYLLGEVGGQAAACLGLEHGDGATLLRSFTVDQRWRGRGWSAPMLSAAYGRLRERGHRGAYLFSADEGAFWAHQGYTPVSPEALAARLPNVPQVRSALEAGWLAEARAWRSALPEKT